MSTVVSSATTSRERAVAAVRDLLLAVGEDARRQELQRTPERVAAYFLEMFSGVGTDPAEALGVPVAMNGSEHADELVAITGIPFLSLCEHHLLAFEGSVDVFYAPNRFTAGFSRVASLVGVASRRPQLQERLGQQIAAAMDTVLHPHGVAVRIEAAHSCVAHLEPQAATARVVTVATIGTIPDAAWRVAVR